MAPIVASIVSADFGDKAARRPMMHSAMRNHEG